MGSSQKNRYENACLCFISKSDKNNVTFFKSLENANDKRVPSPRILSNCGFRAEQKNVFEDKQVYI